MQNRPGLLVLHRHQPAVVAAAAAAARVAFEPIQLYCQPIRPPLLHHCHFKLHARTHSYTYIHITVLTLTIPFIILYCIWPLCSLLYVITLQNKKADDIYIYYIGTFFFLSGHYFFFFFFGCMHYVLHAVMNIFTIC